MPETREELALEMHREARDFQMATEAKLRDRATSVLQAASVVIPVAAIAVSNGPKGVVWAFGFAALAYIACAVSCLVAMKPYNPSFGNEGLTLLRTGFDETLAGMQVRAAEELVKMHDENYGELQRTANWLIAAIIFLVLEIVGLAAALVITVVG